MAAKKKTVKEETKNVIATEDLAIVEEEKDELINVEPIGDDSTTDNKEECNTPAEVVPESCECNKKSFKQKLKKALPFIGAAAGMIGTGVAGVVIGKKLGYNKASEEAAEVIKNKWIEIFKRLQDPEDSYAVHVHNQDTGEDGWLEVILSEKAPNWINNDGVGKAEF